MRVKTAISLTPEETGFMKDNAISPTRLFKIALAKKMVSPSNFGIFAIVSRKPYTIELYNKLEAFSEKDAWNKGLEVIKSKLFNEGKAFGKFKNDFIVINLDNAEEMFL